jgi:hypothetical protein
MASGAASTRPAVSPMRKIMPRSAAICLRKTIWDGPETAAPPAVRKSARRLAVLGVLAGDQPVLCARGPPVASTLASPGLTTGSGAARGRSKGDPRVRSLHRLDELAGECMGDRLVDAMRFGQDFGG